MKVRILPPKKEEPSDGVSPAPINYQVSKEFLDSVGGEITRYGTKIMADGRQWVIHCLTGEPIERKDAKGFKDAKNNIFWIGKYEPIPVIETPKQYVWKNPDTLKI